MPSFLILASAYTEGVYVFGPFDSLQTAKMAQGKIGSVVQGITGNSETRIVEAEFMDGFYCIQNEDGTQTKIKLGGLDECPPKQATPRHPLKKLFSKIFNLFPMQK